jgi:hypothetical protein
MADQTLTKLAAAAPLAIGWLLCLLNPAYDRFIEMGAQREFKDSLYLESGKQHTPVSLITRYTSWALDVAQAGTLVLGPVVGLIVALGGKAKGGIVWLYIAFIIVGFAIFIFTAALEHPVQYGSKKHGIHRDRKLWLGWTRVSIAAIILYFAASVAAFFLA